MDENPLGFKPSKPSYDVKVKHPYTKTQKGREIFLWLQEQPPGIVQIIPNLGHEIHQKYFFYYIYIYIYYFIKLSYWLEF